jgi:3-oxoacyl-[acyl-carrier-protein] synthase II
LIVVVGGEGEAMRKIVITGIGLISPLGLGKERIWEALCREKNFRPRSFDAGLVESEARGRIPDFDELAYMDAKTVKYCQRAEKLALASSRLAFADSGLDADDARRARLGVVIGSMTSNLRAAAIFDQLVLQGEANSMDPSLIPSGIMNSLSGTVSIKNGIRGFHVPVAAGEASGLQAIQFALMQLENGRVDAVLAGAVDEVGVELGLIDCVKNTSPAQKKTGRGERLRGRDDSVYPLSEAAVLLMLESAENAAQRGADTYAECVGFGYSHAPGSISKRAAVGAAIRALEQTCQGEAVEFLDTDFIFTSRNGYFAGDDIEMEALRQFFGPGLPEVTCLQSVFGDSLSAAGPVQVAVAAMAIKESGKSSKGNPDNARLDYPLNRKAGAAKVLKQALVSSFSVDGHLSFLLLRRNGE